MDPLTQTLLQRASQPPQMVGPSQPQAQPPFLGIGGSTPRFSEGAGELTGKAGTPGLGGIVFNSGALPQMTRQPDSFVPAVPPNPSSRVPPAAQRFANAQAIQAAIRNNWSPNPTLLQASLSK